MPTGSPNLTTILLLLFLTFLSLSLAASPTTFCKCTCASNSTIIPLDTPSPADSGNTTLALQRTCNDCTRKFCQDFNLPICRDVEEEQIETSCFQRDSTKDEAIVLIFIFATVGLLAWAAVKPYLARWRGGGVFWHQYAPVVGGRQ